jgi:hypothetical protein
VSVAPRRRRRGKKAPRSCAARRSGTSTGVEAERYGRLPAASDRTGELLALLHALLEPALARRVLVALVGVRWRRSTTRPLSQGSLFDAWTARGAGSTPRSTACARGMVHEALCSPARRSCSARCRSARRVRVRTPSLSL